ncbi:hypothetical protein M747DRAFT_23378 [Aspergillus niger ATCC 13496]|uniref:Uncharacterized protein n=1 Tax=Aspergillus niger ATCC 13496 TaxID=1353008 RepID=A0A370C6D1_ASPNG|nr:hypothetical protein M747DRAFT_23378 [Aspergillus niger ATCC 13496]
MIPKYHLHPSNLPTSIIAARSTKSTSSLCPLPLPMPTKDASVHNDGMMIDSRH